MSLVLKFNVCPQSNCKKFVFTETTGEYDATDNPTGWESPNPLIAWVTAATLDVYKPGNTTTTPDLTVDLYNQTPSWATTDDTQEYTINNTDLGYNGKVPDGIWKFVYTVTVLEVTNVKVYQQTIQKATYCNAACCVDGLFANIEDFECDCMEAQISAALTAKAIFESMVGAAKCGNITKFNKLLLMLQRMCNNQSCCS